jgi:cytochrome c1
MANASALTLAGIWLALATAVTPAAAQTRGALLYTTHCVACHNEKMHWRQKKQAVDWDSLKSQVQLWQATGLLNWNEDDVQQVARHLNDTHYHFAAPPGPAAGGTPVAARPRPPAQVLAAALRPF